MFIRFLTAMLGFLAVGVRLYAQTTYFEQNFSAGGTPASYVSSTPNNSQVNGLSGLNATITNNAVQFSRPTDASTGYISRSSNFAGTPTSLHVQFSFEVISSDPSVTGTSAVMFYVGSNFSSGPTNPNNGDTYARLGIALASTGSGQFQVRTVPSGGGGLVSASFSGKHTITFAMNNSGAALKYVSPTGVMESLPDDTYDIWVGTTKFANDQAVLTANQTINNFKFRLNDGVGVMQIGTIIMRDISGSLPVSLLSFTAKPEASQVQLAWSTTSEQNADRFIIERSRDLTEYIPLGEVAANGTTSTRQNYGLIDTHPVPGVNYYRLTQIDFDGTAYAYKPIAAIVRPNDLGLMVYPQPASPDRIHAQFWNVEEAQIRLLMHTGQVVSGKLEQTNDGGIDFIPAQPLRPGLYLLEIIAPNGQKRTQKVFVP
ncbi:hypothetical protein [Spirosoma sp. KUDC1026]|uniref:hypothetical protein n=1 Tax=Spirosoma sp. KUDC1026 TaxID=2745947 RepID=UPI00159BDB67|nr:hypothetical protein [Spirosoma sp. KUDC1026]QKZ12046.1 hypothetical protein HU175_05145 [Spirosoma sp. KUDC1026]